MAAYYNEFDKGAAEWLRWLIKLGQIAPGEVDERDIRDVRPDDLRGFTQCHFFAGIGGWSLALRLAGWPDDRPVWTGSCPCQPFSAAGKRAGTADERHLWPAFEWLIRACRPVTVMGEQVASKDGLAWLDLVHADLEGQGYTFGALDLCSAGFGAPHIRQRLWFRADSASVRHDKHDRQPSKSEIEGRVLQPKGCRGGIPTSTDSRVSGPQRGGYGRSIAECSISIRTSTDTECIRSGRGSDGDWGRDDWEVQTSGRSAPVPTDCDTDKRGSTIIKREQSSMGARSNIDRSCPGVPDGLTSGFWAGCEWQLCCDGKYRPWEGDAKRSIFAVADGLPADLVHSGETCYPLIGKGQEGRTMRLRGYGNAINPWNAAEFILATEGMV